MSEILAGARAQKTKSVVASRAKSMIPDRVRAEVNKRDGLRCRFCGSRDNVHMHHIRYRSQGGPHENWNLILLCEVHHRLVHDDKKVYAPLLFGVIWAEYVLGRSLTVPQIRKLVGG